MKLTLGIIFIVLTYISYSQNIEKADSIKIDSLNNHLKIHQEKIDTNRINTTLSIGRILLKNNKNLEALKTLENGLADAKSINAEKHTGFCYHEAAIAIRRIGNTEEAIKYNVEAAKLFKKNGLLIDYAYSLYGLAFIYERTGDIEKAVKYNYESTKIFEQAKDTFSIAQNLNQIAVLYYKQKEPTKSLEYFNKALELNQKINNKKEIATTLHNISVVYYNFGDYDKSIEYAYKSINIKEEINDILGIAQSFNHLGVIHFKKDSPKSIGFFKKALSIREEVGDLRGICNTKTNMADYYSSVKLYKESLKLLNEAFQIADSVKNINQKINVSLQYRDLYKKMNDWEQAYKWNEKANILNDSLSNESNARALIQNEEKYKYEKQKAVDDAKHVSQLAIEKEAKEKQQILTYATAGGLGLVGIFLLIVFNRLKVTRKQKTVIEEQKKEVENAHSELEVKNKEITDSIQYAKRIQSAILPPAKLVKEYLQESFILYKPKDIVAGDFYWLEHKNEKTIFAAADCTGHGVPGAMVSVICNNGLNRSVREHNLTDPGKILDKTREMVVKEFEKSEEEVKDGMDIAICSLQNNTLHYAGANNPLWIIREDADDIEEIKANKEPIGKVDMPQPYTTHKIELNKGDTIYIFSDGYADQFGGENGKKLKSSNFKKLLLSIKDENMEKQKELIDQAFENWRGSLEQLDDVCVIGVKIS